MNMNWEFPKLRRFLVILKLIMEENLQEVTNKQKKIKKSWYILYTKKSCQSSYKSVTLGFL